MSASDRKTPAAWWLIFALAAVLLAVLAYAAWHGGNGTANEDPAAGDSPSVEAEPSNREGGVETPPPAETGPSGSNEAPAPEAPAKDADAQAHEILADMRRTWACYESAQCQLGADRDPRAEYFEAGKRMAAGMRTLIEQHQSYQIGDAELAAAAHEVLTYDSGRARAAAIEALHRLPPDKSHLDALTRALDQHHDERLFELAMAELKRYAELGYRSEVDAFLQSNLRSGAHFPARTIARHLGPFLTPDNIGAYEQLARELPSDSPRARLLRQTLADYRRGR